MHKVNDQTFHTHQDFTDKDSHFMDKKDPGQEIPEDLTRESLIAISYTEPQKQLAPGHSTDNLNGQNDAQAVNGDRDEKYRSELIAISYSESPETQGLLVSPEDRKG